MPCQKLDTSPSSENALMIIPSDDSIMVKDENYPINVFMGAGGIEPVPQFQDLGIDTGLQFQSQHTDTDFSETQTVPYNYAYADKPKTLLK